MSQLVDNLKDSYISWLRDRIQLKDVNGAIEITTPLMDRHNDYIQIYVTASSEDKFRITDAGYIIGDLALEGIDVFGSPKRKEIFQTILNRYGVSCSSSNELYTNASIKTFPQRKHMLLQALVNINDMFMVSKANVSSIFIDEVANFLDEYDVRNSPDIAFVGRTGYTHQFDFLIPKSKIQPERVIKSVNQINKQSASLMIFSWTDTREIRGSNAELYVFVNDSSKKVSDNSLEAFREYGIHGVRWSRRLDVLPQLIA